MKLSKSTQKTKCSKRGGKIDSLLFYIIMFVFYTPFVQAQTYSKQYWIDKIEDCQNITDTQIDEIKNIYQKSDDFSGKTLKYAPDNVLLDNAFVVYSNENKCYDDIINKIINYYFKENYQLEIKELYKKYLISSELLNIAIANKLNNIDDSGKSGLVLTAKNMRQQRLGVLNILINNLEEELINH